MTITSLPILILSLEVAESSQIKKASPVRIHNRYLLFLSWIQILALILKADS